MKTFLFLMIFSTSLWARENFAVTGLLNSRTTPYSLIVNQGTTNEQSIWIEGLSMDEAIIYDGTFVYIEGRRDLSIPHTLLKPKSIRPATADEIELQPRKR
jgi:hypothetical protein